jgi:hypothetical protein
MILKVFVLMYIHKTQEIYLARGEDKRQVEILLPVSHTLDEFKVPFNNIKSYFVKIREVYTWISLDNGSLQNSRLLAKANRK